MNKTYWVLSEGENPAHIFFDETTAKEMGDYFNDPYLDVFDYEGRCVERLKFVDNIWTEDF